MADALLKDTDGEKVHNMKLIVIRVKIQNTMKQVIRLTISVRLHEEVTDYCKDNRRQKDEQNLRLEYLQGTYVFFVELVIDVSQN